MGVFPYIANPLQFFPCTKKFEKNFKITRPRNGSPCFILGHEESICAQDIAIKTGLPKKQHQSRRQLAVEKGILLLKTDDPEDGRRSILNLTTTGWKLYSQTPAFLPLAETNAWYQNYQARKLQQLNRLLLKLCAEIETALECECEMGNLVNGPAPNFRYTSISPSHPVRLDFSCHLRFLTKHHLICTWPPVPPPPLGIIGIRPTP